MLGSQCSQLVHKECDNMSPVYHRHVTCHQLHGLSSVRQQLGLDVTVGLVTAVVLDRLDYCNAILAGLPMSTFAPR